MKLWQKVQTIFKPSPRRLARPLPGPHVTQDWEIDPIQHQIFSHKYLAGYPVSPKYPTHALSRYTVVDTTRPLPPISSSKESRATACFVGGIVGDALGAPLEFSPVRYDSKELKGFDTSLWVNPDYNTFTLSPGQWTDDSSMMIALGESLLVHPDLDLIDVRCRFQAWWYFGYCNANGWSENPKGSVGLGASIGESFDEFLETGNPKTTTGTNTTNGNGSIIRNGVVPLFFSCTNDVPRALEYSRLQSLTTHQGTEASECCALLSHICMAFIQGQDKMNVLENLDKTFHSDLYSITCLCLGIQEDRHPQNTRSRQGITFGSKDTSIPLHTRNWNWRDKYFSYSLVRASHSPGYIGSYCMDAMAMAIHIVYTTNSFDEATLKAANLRGDSDSVACVTAQIAGSLYGMEAIPSDWLDTVFGWDPTKRIMHVASNLYHNKTIKQ